MTKEDPSEALQGPEVQEAGESSPRLGYETYLSSGAHGSTSPTTLDWGQPASWVASSKQASGDKLPEHSEVNPTVCLCHVNDLPGLSGTNHL